MSNQDLAKGALQLTALALHRLGPVKVFISKWPWV